MVKHFSKYRCISLFSGAGGLDVGFARAGYKIAWANDYSADACKTYSLNHKSPIRCGDIREYMDELANINDIDIVFGGPPCQGFSVAGKMDPNDERSKMLFVFFDVVERVKPKAFVLENVKALAKLSRWASIRSEMIKRAKDLGYDHIELIVLKASDYGVPQKRERMFFIGIRADGDEIDTDAILGEVEKQRKPAEPISYYFKKLGRVGSATNTGICNAKITVAKKPVLRASAYAGMIFNGAGRPINPQGYANTLTASMGGSRTPIIDEAEIFDNQESWIELYHSQLRSGRAQSIREIPVSLRRITTQEAAVIQAFPTDYKFYGTQSSVYRQIGNAVPCELAYVVALALKKTLSRNARAAFSYKTVRWQEAK